MTSVSTLFPVSLVNGAPNSGGSGKMMKKNHEHRVLDVRGYEDIRSIKQYPKDYDAKLSLFVDSASRRFFRHWRRAVPPTSKATTVLLAGSGTALLGCAPARIATPMSDS
jgi:hypothetical protein